MTPSHHRPVARPVWLPVLGMLLIACAPGDDPTTSATSAAARSYLALGDSYTIGEGVAESERWPVVLAAALSSAGIGEVAVEVVARTGWTTAELDLGIDQAGVTGSFDLVTLLIGVNNQYRGLSLSSYAVEFAALLDRAISFADDDPTRVVVVSIPDWGFTPFATGADRARIGAEIDRFNEEAGAIAEDAGVAWVDVTAISRSDVAGLVGGDGLHPSAAQYRLWVDAILPLALTALQG